MATQRSRVSGSDDRADNADEECGDNESDDGKSGAVPATAAKRAE
eukprot:CAMPEP_0197414226 /NCGR_PEP_ID=MMETSP1170-20131217/989_1 /TAXON_ID=54406 /ORGANISM="Sarcinochrysis sp, Strain CCMP770" /LENGTH=44 /DNA_ID= /DNA_START= /DNA_END= /DNA_ORIENTATION=